MKKMNFFSRKEEMNLELLSEDALSYSDQFGIVLIEKLQTKNTENPDYCKDIPWYAISTKSKTEDEFKFQTVLSNNYKFIGHDILCSSIREFIKESGNAIIEETKSVSLNKMRLYNEITIRNSNCNLESDDILPQILIRNSYDGSGAAHVGFGICIKNKEQNLKSRFTFRNKLGHFRQLHTQNSKTILVHNISTYSTSFTENIDKILKLNFNNYLNMDDILNTINGLEKIGKRNQNEISVYINNLLLEEKTKAITNKIEFKGISNWNMFLTILKFSTKSKNLNSKIILENIAETYLILPEEMESVINEIN